jgi:hypothetical protein
MTAPAKPKYRTTNWKDYNMALKVRGSLLIWLDKDMCWQGKACSSSVAWTGRCLTSALSAGARSIY